MLTSFHFILLQFAVGISPIIHLVWSLKILRNLGFQFLLGITVVPREIEDNVYAKNLEGGGGGGGGANKVYVLQVLPTQGKLVLQLVT